MSIRTCRVAAIGEPGARILIGHRHGRVATRLHERLGDEGRHLEAGQLVARAVEPGIAAQVHVLPRP